MSIANFSGPNAKPKSVSHRLKGRSLASLKKLAWKLLSLKIRRQASNSWGNCKCYTCGATHRYQELQAGHAIGGRHGAVLFDTDIIRPQCVACNVFLRGNYPIFVTKLIKEHGLDWWESKLLQSRQVRKWSRNELEDLIKRYS